ncbi:MAG: hypothetical protein D4R79_14225 [Comamonadaceae bacterium]|nr:MAG: hypothetical protein D4R79_14225 [Comamonadaceae bacterium]
MQFQTFQRFSSVIRSLSANELGGAPTLFDKLRITGDGSVEVCYAPFEYINEKAQVVIVNAKESTATAASSNVLKTRRLRHLYKNVSCWN